MSVPVEELVDVLIAVAREEGRTATDLSIAIHKRDTAQPGSSERMRARKLVSALTVKRAHVEEATKRARAALLVRIAREASPAEQTEKDHES